MDYSSTIADSENPAGASPWGSSPLNSPQRASSSYMRDDLAAPSSPFGARQTSFASPDLSSGRSFGQAESVGDASGTDDDLRSPIAAEAVPDTPILSQDTSKSQHLQHQRQTSATEQATPGLQVPQTDAKHRSQVQQPTSHKLHAKITGLERTGKKDPIIRFDVHTNLNKFRTTQFRDVRRTHSEFVKLGEHLISSNPEAIVPAVPPSLTSAGAGTDEDEARVKASLQRWFNYVCSNEVLIRDDEMVLFVESDFGYSPMLKRKQPATGVRRRVIKQFAPPPDDTPELRDARPIVKMFYLGAMDAGHKVDKVVKARRCLGASEADFGVKLSSMSVQEPHSGLSNAYRKLGKTIQASGDFHAAQGTAEATTIGDPLQYHSQDAFIVKETLTNRHILLRDLVAAQQLTRNKLMSADRLKASSSVRREKVDEAINTLDEARNIELYLTGKTERVTANLLIDQRKWFQRTASDLRLSIREYALRQIEAERRTLATLESVRPDVRAIDSSGGLSRLGREAHPVARRSSLAASQGPKGDAWSGVPRRPETMGRSISGMSSVPEDGEEEGRNGVSTIRTPSISGLALQGVAEEDDDDRIDARNAASRLATSTF